MQCQCGASIPPTVGRGRPRKRCAACAADRSQLGKDWRAANPRRVKTYNAARRADYAAGPAIARARGRLRYALKVGGRVAEARNDLEQLLARAA